MVCFSAVGKDPMSHHPKTFGYWTVNEDRNRARYSGHSDLF